MTDIIVFLLAVHATIVTVFMLRVAKILDVSGLNRTEPVEMADHLVICKRCKHTKAKHYQPHLGPHTCAMDNCSCVGFL